MRPADEIEAMLAIQMVATHDLAMEMMSRAKQSEFMQRLLSLMNITGTKLLDREGLASDMNNSYNYNRKTGFVWDLQMEPPDDTKM